jgi:hypothetical protein
MQVVMGFGWGIAITERVCVCLFNVQRKPWHVTTVLGGAHRTIGRQGAIRASWSVLANLIIQKGFIRSYISTVLQLSSVNPSYGCN